MNTSTTLTTFRDSDTTLANRDRDFSEWHGGRPYYYCWTVMVEALQWQAATDRAIDQLFPWLVPGYARQGHVTILPAGFAEKGLNGQQVAEIARSIQPFELALGPLGSFTSSPCFEIRDPSGSLLKLRKLLRPVLFDPCSVVRDNDYQAHLTVGLYRACFPTDAIAKKIENFPIPDCSPIQVGEISLSAYDTHSIKGPLTQVARFDLGSGVFTPLNHPFLFQ